MIKIVTIIGARPQIIKAAAISRAISQKFRNDLSEIIVHTGQHYDNNMSDVFIKEMDIPLPKYNLNVGSGLHGVQTARMIEGIEELLIKEKPGYILLYGDTNSTLAGAVAASKLHVPIIHVEAGLRSFNRMMPEEINRLVCDHLSTMLFSPTRAGIDNLVKEGVFHSEESYFTAEKPGVFHCGDVMFDNSLFFGKKAQEQSTVLEENALKENEYILATLHRDHNTDIPENFNSIFKAFIEISKDKAVVLPLHPRSKKILNLPEHSDLLKEVNETKLLKIIDPVSFLDMIQLEQNAALIMTDSGGVQKESYFFNKPCIILRPETEWVEVLETGKAKLAGADYHKIISSFKELIKMPFQDFPKIFGDGKAAEFICQTVIDKGGEVKE